MNEIKIITLLPTRGFVLTETEDALDRELAANKQIPFIVRTHDLPLPLSRNYLVETALKHDWWTHALLLDDDVIMPKGMLKELIKLKADVAVTNYPMHGKVEGKACGTVVHDKDGSIAFAGLGCVLVTREAFEKLESPWFVGTNYRIGKGANGEVGFYASQQDSGNPFSAGEDTHFFLQCRKNNLKVKEAKLTATHARLDRMVTVTHASRYSQQHQIVKSDKIERELL